MADMYPVHVGIIKRLREALAAAGLDPVKSLFDGKVPDGQEIPLLAGSVSGQIAPHACLLMDEPGEHPGGAAIDGPVDALGVLVFEVLAVAPNALMLTQLRDVINRALIGWELPGGSVVSADGGLAAQPVVGMVKPQRYVRYLGYWGSVGASGSVYTGATALSN